MNSFNSNFTSANKPESWYDKSLEQIERHFKTNRGKGLSDEDAAKVRRQIGGNHVYKTPSATLSFKKLIPADYASLLLVAAVLAAMVFDIPVAGGVLLSLVAVNYLTAVFTYIKAQKVLCGMTEYSLPTAKVIRDGRLTLVDMRALVPGDVIFLSAGDIVPADCRIFAADNLYINEGTLTGIPSSVLKNANFTYFAPGLPYEKQLSMAFATTIVTSGNGRAIVTATGENTVAVHLGKTTEIVTHENLKILSTLKKYCSGWSLSMLAMIFIITIITLLFRPEQGAFHVFFTGISLAAAAMSELYTVFGYTIIGCGIFSAMNRKNDVNVGALIKNAEKLEQLKDLTTLIVPKDGILTEAHANAEKIYVSRRLYEATDVDRVDRLRPAVIAGVVSTGIYGAGLAALSGSSRKITPEEQAIVELAETLGLYNANIDRSYPIIGHVPAGGASKFETTLTLDANHRYMAVCRGDAEAILSNCEYYTENGNIHRMTTKDRIEFLGAAQSLIKSSYRVLAVATGVTDFNNLDSRIGAIQADLTFEGLIALREPLCKGAAQLISRCKAAGIRIIMTTDRYSESDKYLAMSVGIVQDGKGILTGAGYDAMSEDLLRTNLPLYNMYAGVEPAKLANIVSLLRKDGERVGLLAGGINGALLLKKADVGFTAAVTISPKAKKSGIDIKSRQTPAFSRIAGGSLFESEALKFISDVVISDADNHGKGGFSAIVSAIEYARTIYRNLLRMVRYLTTIELTRIFIVIGSLFLGFNALTPIQLAVSGLALDFTAILASAFAKPSHNALFLDDNAEKALQKPLTLFVRSLLFSLFGAVSLLAIRPVAALFGTPMSDDVFGSTVFLALLLCQLVTFAELAADRSLFLPGFRPCASYGILFLGAVCFIAACLIFPTFGAIFDVSSVGMAGWIGIAACTLLTFAVNEVFKLVTSHATKTWGV